MCVLVFLLSDGVLVERRHHPKGKAKASAERACAQCKRRLIGDTLSWRWVVATAARAKGGSGGGGGGGGDGGTGIALFYLCSGYCFTYSLSSWC